MSYPHWQYFLSIEDDLLRCSRYVEFDSQNFGTFSVEFARVIVAAASEFDAVAKKLCKVLQPAAAPRTINAYRPIILGKYPKFVDYTIHIPRAKLKFQPWSTWSATASPDWWSKGYNMIKHQRDAHFPAANLENAIFATAALLAGIVYLYDAEYGSVPRMDLGSFPQLFEPQDHPNSGIGSGGLFWSCQVWK